MRALGLLFLVLVIPAANCAPSAVPAKLDAAGSCQVCHADVVATRTAKSDVHADVSCDGCHPGRIFNPHVRPTLDAQTQQQAEAFAGVATHTAAAYTQCQNCHADVLTAWRASAHGPRADDKPGLKKPNCSSCHGSIHSVTKDARSKLRLASNCIACHSFAVPNKVPTAKFVVDTFRDTIHGKMVALGNAKAAACADCHTGHNVFPPADARSTVNLANRQKTCGKCHSNATASFVEAISHKPHTVNEDFWAGVTAIGFSVLTIGVIALLFLHVILDFLRTGHRAWSKPQSEKQAGDGPITADAEVERFDIHMRLQHWGMMASFITLVVTGWPLKAARIGASTQLVDFFGGQHVLALIHRIAGGLLIAVAVYHLAYLIWLWTRGRLTLGMMPALKDITDVFGNVLYFFGLKKERPKFERWAYHEKFDYWAVFWGMAIMGGSGLILWFPVFASHLLPGELISLSYIAHSDEALLALLAIFLWHFYNTHLRPTVFPMSWVWLTGRISAEALYEEHRAEYEHMFGKNRPAPAATPSGWHHEVLWSYAAVALVLLSGVAVVLANISSVRDQIATLTGEQITLTNASAPGVVASRPDAAISVYDPKFDAFTRCFACHNEERFKQGGAGFPHRRHLDEIQIGAACKDCHQGTWHRQMVIKTDLCLGCHKAEKIGLSRRK